MLCWLLEKSQRNSYESVLSWPSQLALASIDKKRSLYVPTHPNIFLTVLLSSEDCMTNIYKKYDSLGDTALIDAIIGGDALAVEFLLSVRCGGAFKRLCQTYRASRIEAEDLAQEMCLHLLENDWQSLRAFRGMNMVNGRKCKLTTYIITCAARWIKRKNDGALKEIDWSAALTNGEGKYLEIRDDKHDKTQLRISVIDAIMSLPNPQERIVLIEYKIKERRPEEVAELLHLKTGAKGTVENVYTICSRAMKNLRILIEKGDVYA
jgi:RNA polymerase sigma factor (sigma-70 family)